jgi:hypothetical protein
VVERDVRPGTISTFRAHDFHRIRQLRSRESWSLFFSWSRTQPWGFWNRSTGKYTPWREFVKPTGVQ